MPYSMSDPATRLLHSLVLYRGQRQTLHKQCWSRAGALIGNQPLFYIIYIYFFLPFLSSYSLSFYSPWFSRRQRRDTLPLLADIKLLGTKYIALPPMRKKKKIKEMNLLTQNLGLYYDTHDILLNNIDKSSPLV